ncbi:MAG: glycoside hydrolase family 3 C-terminal domain-containing protein [Lachnospiraceae bacterium]|nr:glycoside hydrolase family 3 C-terminal domain-containing protein [Lachnospiraceae bacterium]
MKTERKTNPVRRWLIVSAVLLAFMVAVTTLVQTVFYEPVSLFLGRAKPVYKEGAAAMYVTDTVATKEEAFEKANVKTVEICEEGFVLLKNRGNEALPLSKGAKVSVFGKNSVNLSYGASGSSGFTDVVYKTIYDSLEAAGFQANPELKAFYEDDKRSGSRRATNSTDLDSGGNQKVAVSETPQSLYTEELKKSYQEYADAALVVLTRIGGEGFDLPRYQGDTEGAVRADSHYLELDQNERDLLSAVCEAGFDKVVVIFNTPTVMEAGFLENSDDFAMADRIDGAIWIGFTGGEGIMALGEILNGSVNPSGRTVDTWAADFTADPTFVNFGTGPRPDSSDKYDDGLYYFVDYEEDIYVGYRYYETRGLTEGEDWYRSSVVYPFGYGLSYTSFDWELESSDKDTFSAEESVQVLVRVTNTGDRPGKDVVQVYGQAPYMNGGIEKAARVLVGFAKTKELQSGESETVSITIDPYSLASYDYRDRNENGFYGYELEAGEYSLAVSRNAHEPELTVALTLTDGVQYETDPMTGVLVGNRYTQEGSVTETDLSDVADSDVQLSTVLSRADFAGTFPDENTPEERAKDSARLRELQDITPNNPTDFETLEYPEFGGEVTLQIKDLLPETTPEESHLPFVPYEGGEWDEKWQAILSGCQEEELIRMLNNGAYQTMAVPSINMPATIEGDGTAGFTCFLNKQAINGTCHYCSEPVMASTWNIELIEELGETIGDEALMGNGTSAYSGIYAPGANIHRSPFGGRAAEYYSEDPFLSGKLAAAMIRGTQKKGVICSIKHFAVNEQETHRSINGDCSYLTEQALREIYLKPFEIAVKEGRTRGLMSSFNRIGRRWTGGDYRLLTEILREEWGFTGAVICDFNTIPQYMNSRQMAYAGGDINLATLPEEWCDTSDMADAIVLSQCAKNILYTYVNSNAMRGEVDHYETPAWIYYFYAADAVILVLLALWGLSVFRRKAKE